MGEGSPRQRQVATRDGVREGQASFSEVSGHPKTSPCGVSEMVEGEGMGCFCFLLPRSQWTDGKVPRRHPQFACKKKVWGWVSPNWTPAAGVWVGRQRRGKSRGLLRVYAPAPFNPKHPIYFKS